MTSRMVTKNEMDRWNVDKVIEWLRENGFNEAQREVKRLKINGSQLMAYAREKIPKDLFGLGRSKTEKLINNLKDIENHNEFASDDSFESYEDESELAPEADGYINKDNNDDETELYTNDTVSPRSPSPGLRPPSLLPRTVPPSRPRVAGYPKVSVLDASARESIISEDYEYPDFSPVVERQSDISAPSLGAANFPTRDQEELDDGSSESDYETTDSFEEVRNHHHHIQKTSEHSKPSIPKVQNQTPRPPLVKEPEYEIELNEIHKPSRQPLPPLPSPPPMRSKANRPVPDLPETNFESPEKLISPTKMQFHAPFGHFKIDPDELAGKRSGLKPTGKELKKETTVVQNVQPPLPSFQKNTNKAAQPPPIKAPGKPPGKETPPSWKQQNANRVQDYHDISPEKPARQEKKAVLPPKTPTKNSDVEDQKWFRQNTREEASTRLKSIKKNGAFIVRPSIKDSSKPYTLCLYVDGIIKNIPIRKLESGKFALGLLKKPNEMVFDSVCHMVKHYSREKLITTDPYQEVTLVHVD